MEKGELTRDLQLFGKMSPICRLFLWNQQKQTISAKKAGKKPVWSETFKFFSKRPAENSQSSAENSLKIEVFNEKFEEKEFLGSASVKIAQLGSENSRNIKEWVEIFCENKKSGRVFVSYLYERGKPSEI